MKTRLLLLLSLGAALTMGCDDDDAATDAPQTDAAVTLDGAVDAGEPDAAAEPDMAVDPDAEPDAESTGYVVEEILIEDVQFLNGQTEMLQIDLPDDVVGLTIFGRDLEGDHALVVGRLMGPDGEVLVSPSPEGVNLNNYRQISPFPGQFGSPNRSTQTAEMQHHSMHASLLAPNNPNVAITPGTWSFSLTGMRIVNGGIGGMAAGKTDISVLVKRAPVEPTVGSLQLHLHFTGAHNWTAENAPTDEDFQAALTRMRTFYEAVGIALLEPTYHDVDPAYRDTDLAELGDLWATTEWDTGVSLFFIDRITGGPMGGGIGGVASGTPGPTHQPNAGVVIATALEPAPESIGHIMGHETGHFLGLFHTEEIYGIYYNMPGLTDQIDDTADGEAGNLNLMYPTVTAGQASLSDGQGWVLHRNPNIK